MSGNTLAQCNRFCRAIKRKGRLADQVPTCPINNIDCPNFRPCVPNEMLDADFAQRTNFEAGRHGRRETRACCQSSFAIAQRCCHVSEGCGELAKLIPGITSIYPVPPITQNAHIRIVARSHSAGCRCQLLGRGTHPPSCQNPGSS